MIRTSSLDVAPGFSLAELLLLTRARAIILPTFIHMLILPHNLNILYRIFLSVCLALAGHHHVAMCNNNVIILQLKK